jgi:hypothetical protein
MKTLTPVLFAFSTVLSLTLASAPAFAMSVKKEFRIARYAFDHGTLPEITDDVSVYAGRCYTDPTGISKDRQERSTNPYTFTKEGSGCWLTVKKVDSNIEMALIRNKDEPGSDFYLNSTKAVVLVQKSIQEILAETTTKVEDGSLTFSMTHDEYGSDGVDLKQKFRTYDGQMISESDADPSEGGVPVLCYWFKLND